MAPSKPSSAKTGVEGTKKKRGGEKGEFTLKRVKGKSTLLLLLTIVISRVACRLLQLSA